MMTIKNSLRKITSLFTAVVMVFVLAAVPPKKAYADQIPDNELKSMANELGFLVNEIRAEHGLNPVYVVPYLCDMAQVRAREIIFKFDHRRPDNTKFSSLIDTNLVPYEVLYENIAAGSDKPQDTMTQWVKSEKHFSVILTPEITHMGMGAAYEENSEYQWYWQQTFAICDQDLPGQFLPTRYDITPQAEGDITGDAVIDSYDYLALADYLYKKANNIPVYLNPAQLETADCFRDGLITESDAKVMVRYILGEYQSLPFVF